MKKIIKTIVGIILCIVMFLSICPKTYAVLNPTLEDIANIFNACKRVKKYNQDSETMNLSASYNIDPEKDTNTLTVRVSDKGEVTNLTYRLQGTILEARYTGGDTKERQEYWPEITKIIVDCIGQFHGYAEGEMFNTLNSSEISNYTLEEDGLMISNNSPNLFLAQIDITKVISLLDTNTYIKEEDLEDYKTNLTGDGIVKYKKGKMVFYKYTVNDKDILVVGEQNGFSYIINRSIQSILKVMFESDDAVEYFTKNYPKTKSSKQFDGFKIEANPIRNSAEENVLSTDDSYKFVRITIDRAAVKTAIEDEAKKEAEKEEKEKEEETKKKTESGETGNSGSGSSQTGGTSSESSQTGTTTENSGVLPKTGEDATKEILTYLYFVLVAALVGIMFISIKSKKKQK